MSVNIYDASTGTLTRVDKNPVFTGATASAAGAKGVVPAPAAGDEDKYLKGDGSWAEAAADDNYVGTKAAWDQMQASEKEKYKTADFTDDMDGYLIDDVPTSGSQNVVKSGGVYSQINAVSSALTNKEDKFSFVDRTSSDITTIIENHWGTDIKASGMYYIETSTYVWSAQVFYHSSAYGSALVTSYGNSNTNEPTFYTMDLFNNTWTVENVQGVLNDLKKSTDGLYTLSIPYNSSHTGDVLWMLQDALANNKFKNGEAFVGTIMPAGRGFMSGFMYIASNQWYGNVMVLLDGIGHFYNCSQGTFTLTSRSTSV